MDILSVGHCSPSPRSIKSLNKCQPQASWLLLQYFWMIDELTTYSKVPTQKPTFHDTFRRFWLAHGGGGGSLSFVDTVWLRAVMSPSRGRLSLAPFATPGLLTRIGNSPLPLWASQGWWGASGRVGFWVETLLYVVNSCSRGMGDFPCPCEQAKSGETLQGGWFLGGDITVCSQFLSTKDGELPLSLCASQKWWNTSRKVVFWVETLLYVVNSSIVGRYCKRS